MSINRVQITQEEKPKTGLPRLLWERELLAKQFPLVAAVNNPPTIYRGLIRCEKGPVYELAKKGIWPFTQYIEFNQFEIRLPPEYALKPPRVIWLTPISHPNIVPYSPDGVCLPRFTGDQWRPSFTLALVVEALVFLLSDPNPLSPFKYPNCPSPYRNEKDENVYPSCAINYPRNPCPYRYPTCPLGAAYIAEKYDFPKHKPQIKAIEVITVGGGRRETYIKEEEKLSLEEIGEEDILEFKI